MAIFCWLAVGNGPTEHGGEVEPQHQKVSLDKNNGRHMESSDLNLLICVQIYIYVYIKYNIKISIQFPLTFPEAQF